MKNVIVCLADRYVYRNDPKCLDRQVRANSVDPDKIAPDQGQRHETCMIL